MKKNRQFLIVQNKLLKSLSILLLLPVMALADNTGKEKFPLMDCIITPSAITDVSSGVPGVIESVKVERSDQVIQGQVVAELDAGVEKASLAVSQVRAGIDADVQLSKVNLDFDERRRNRVELLRMNQAVSYQDKDNATREAYLSKWKLKQAKEILRLRDYERLQAEEILKQKTIRSPISGVVAQKFKSVGEYVEDQPIVRVVKLDPLFVEAVVPLELFGQIHNRMPAEVFLETANDDDSYMAKVSVVDKMGDAASGTFGVRLILPNEDHHIPAGLRCSVRFKNTPVKSQATVEVEQKNVTEVDMEDVLTTDADVEVLADEPERKITKVQTHCLQLGPMDSNQQAMQLREALGKQGSIASILEIPVVKTAGYIVLAKQVYDSETSSSVIQRLQSAGVTDYAVMGKGAYQGFISTGVYNGPLSAAKRRNDLLKRGIESEVRQRSQIVSTWWLEMDTVLSDEQVWPGLSARYAKLIPAEKVKECSGNIQSVSN